jgi:D-serine deaminase-like pyridoxal phosphate-dependent protein
MYNKVTEKVAELDRRYRERYPDMDITCGDTPGCSLADSFAPISEITPGNFVFYDLMQLKIGSCGVDDIAVAVACPVVGVNADKGEVVIHGGAVHFSKDQQMNGLSHFGLVAETLEEGWGGIVPETRLAKISQEHGIIHSSNQLWLDNIALGDVVHILPVHSCLTADVVRCYRLTDGDWISGPAGFMP